jgi:hypothetical protein
MKRRAKPRQGVGGHYYVIPSVRIETLRNLTNRDHFAYSVCVAGIAGVRAP